MQRESSSAKGNLISDIHFLFALRYVPDKDHGLEFSPHGIPKGLEPGNKCSIALSGGIDSEFLLKALTRRIVDEYSVDFEGICCSFTDSRAPEAEQARIIAENYDIGFKNIIIDDPLKDLDKLIEIVGEPRYNLYPYYVYKESRKFLWTGDGADEACLGYTWRYKQYLDNVASCRNWQDRVKLYLSTHENDWVIDQEQFFSEKYKFDWNPIFEYFKQFFYTDIGLGAVMLADINGKLRHDYIPNGFKLSNAVGINLVTPYLDKEVFNSLIKAPMETKYDYATNTGKILLRRRLNRMDDKSKVGFGFDLQKYYVRKGYDLIHNKINRDSHIFEYVSRDWFIRNMSSVETRIINKYLQCYALEIYLELLEENKIKEKELEVAM